MTHFTYKARKNTGEVYDGELDAADKYQFYKMIKEAGGEVISFKEHQKSAARGILNLSITSGIKVQDKITFARNLGAMVQAGLSVSRALSVIERQSKNKQFKSIIVKLNEDISKGTRLSDSMKNFPKMFSPLFVSMVRVGEESGTLADAMKVVAVQMDRSYALSRRIRGALMYPGVILVVMSIIAVIMLTYIVPTLIGTFSGMNVKLPATTMVLVNLSDLLRHHGLLVAASIIVGLTIFHYWHKTPKGKSVVDYMVLKIPVLGPVVKEVNTARTARTMASLISSGVDIVESVVITTDVLQNVHYKRILLKAQESIKKGEPLSKVFTENDTFYPTFIAEMMSVGEETGKMGEMLLNVAVFYEDSVEQSTKDLSTIIEPVMMVMIGGAVGYFAVAMISPMYSLANSIT